jgi:hypothetical protein
MGQNDTKKREKAAQLVAEDCLSDEKIAAGCVLRLDIAHPSRRTAVRIHQPDRRLETAARAIKLLKEMPNRSESGP